MYSHRQFSFIAALAAVSMATMGVFSRYSELPAETLTFFRLLLGALCILGVVKYQGLVLGLTRAVLLRCVVCGFFLAGFIVFYIQSMNFTLMANAIFMVYLGPVAATLMARIFRSQHLTVVQWLFMLLALTGFMFMQQGVSLADLNIGMVYASLAMLCYGGFIFMNGALPHSADTAVTAFWQLLTGAVVMLPVLLLTNQSWIFTPTQWGLLITVGILPGFIALYCAVVALKHLSTGVYGTITYLEPVAVSLFGWVLFAEALSVMQLFGGTLIIFAGVAQAITLSSPSPEPSSV